MKELTLLCDLLELRRLERPLCSQLVEEVQGVDAARQVGFGVFSFLGSRGFLTSLASGSRSHCRGRLGCCRHLGGSGDALQLSLSSASSTSTTSPEKKNQFFQTKQVVKKHRQQDHEALGRRKIERGPLWTCRVHRRQLHRGYPIVLPYPRAIICGLSYSYTSTFLVFLVFLFFL